MADTTNEQPEQGTDSTAEKRPPIAQLQGVKYTGTADFRGLTVDDLKSIGADNPKGDIYVGRDQVIPVGDLNASTVDALLTQTDFEAV